MFQPRVSRSVLLSATALLVLALAGPRAGVAALGDCSQPVSTGANPVATDCLFVLQVAVGAGACTPQPCVCDPTGDSNTTATDALTCLRKAVGQAILLLCPCLTTTTLINTADCTDDGSCLNDDCVCSDCDTDLFCSNPTSCNHNGVCQEFREGCVCADCTTHPECLDN